MYEYFLFSFTFHFFFFSFCLLMREIIFMGNGIGEKLPVMTLSLNVHVLSISPCMNFINEKFF